jgi:hypothetical protein
MLVEGLSFRGHKIHQLPDEYPWLHSIYTALEYNFDPEDMVRFARENFTVPCVAVAVYLTSIVVGNKLMSTRERFDLRYILAGWNGFLAIFSLVGAVRTVTHLFWNLNRWPLRDTICVPAEADWGAGATGLWVGLFIYSKLFELFDTFFIVVRKRPLAFIHWYHHVTVLLYCWHAYATEAPHALYFVAMNYSVHAIMYGYYCLMALRIMPKWFPAGLITLAQISQMIIGVAVQVVAMIIYRSEADLPRRTCPLVFSNLTYGAIMYTSYLLLFVQFAVQRFVFAGAKSKAE